MEEEKISEKSLQDDDEVLEEDIFEREPDYDDATVLDNIKAVGEFVVDMKNAVKDSWNTSSKADKAKLLLIILPFLIGLAIGGVGVAFANVGQALKHDALLIIGFILMGTGFGSAFLTIIITVTVHGIKNRKHRR